MEHSRNLNFHKQLLCTNFFSRLKEKNLGKEIGMIILLLFRSFVASFLELIKFGVKIILVRTEAIAYSSKKRFFHIIYNNFHNNHYLISVLYGQKTIELYVYKYIYKYNFIIIIIISKKIYIFVLVLTYLTLQQLEVFLLVWGKLYEGRVMSST